MNSRKAWILSPFYGDRKTINAVVRSLEAMGETARQIPEEVRQEHPTIPWRECETNSVTNTGEWTWALCGLLSRRNCLQWSGRFITFRGVGGMD